MDNLFCFFKLNKTKNQNIDNLKNFIMGIFLISCKDFKKRYV